MELQDFLRLIRKKTQTIILIIIIAILFTATITLLLPLRYEARSRLLITQSADTSDAYTLSRSNEYLGNLFSQVIQSSSFLDLTLASSYNVDKDYFNKEAIQKMQLWKKTVQAKTYSDSGIVEINVYHTSPYQAQQIALAVNDVLLNKGQNYHSGGDRIKINIIDQPLISNYPVKPNIVTNLILAFIFSFMFSLFYVYIFPEQKYDLKLFKSKKQKYKLIKEEKAKEMVWQNLPYQNTPETNNQEPHKDRDHKHATHRNVSTDSLEGNIQNILK